MTHTQPTPPATEPAYDYRHHVELVQTIATGKWVNLYALLKAWEVPIDRMWCDRDGKPTFDGMVMMLSRYLTPDESDWQPRTRTPGGDAAE